MDKPPATGSGCTSIFPIAVFRLNHQTTRAETWPKGLVLSKIVPGPVLFEVEQNVKPRVEAEFRGQHHATQTQCWPPKSCSTLSSPLIQKSNWSYRPSLVPSNSERRLRQRLGDALPKGFQLVSDGCEHFVRCMRLSGIVLAGMDQLVCSIERCQGLRAQCHHIEIMLLGLGNFFRREPPLQVHGILRRGKDRDV
jgi:hypothetical protein